MIRRLISILLVLAAMLSAAQRTSAQSRVAAGCLPADVQNTASPQPIVHADNRFGFSLFRTVAGTRNVFLSPVSIAIALQMAYDGSRGTSALAMAQTLDIAGMSRPAVRAGGSALLASLRSAGLSAANSLWIRAHVAIRTPFVQHARQSYGATVQRLDFDSPQAPAAINHWVRCASRGTIPSIVSSIPHNTLLYLLNAVYFHGIWQHGFDPSVTHTRTFEAPGGTIEVPMMSQTARLFYASGFNYQAIQLPYTSGRMSMVVIEPRGIPLVKFVHSLTAARFGRMVSAMTPQSGTLQLPRFSVSDDRILNGPLSALGMGVAFTRAANFSGICVQPCKLTQVRHKTYLSVNEHGTVASAVTSIGVGATAMPIASFTMTVDHPFVVAIEDSKTGAVAFLGAVSRP